MSALPHESRSYSAPAALDRALAFGRVNYEIIGYAALILASIVAHLWALGHMAMHHDESIHAWMSWKFFTGNGGFNCAGGRASPSYCYDPVYHGPSLYFATLISYFLFGIGEAQARLPQAMAGIGLIASCWTLRPLVGRRAAFLSAVILAFAPSILYYTRFARHDGLMLLWTFWIVVGFFRFLQDGRARWLYLLAVGAALAVATHELYYILIFLFGFFLLARVVAELIPRRTLTLALGVLFGVALLIELLVLPLGLSRAWSGLALLFATVSGVSLLLLRVWDDRPLVVERSVALWREERGVIWIALGIFFTIYVLLYSTFFTYPLGIIDGAYQGISYWLGSQQEYARGKQPWYYYLMLLPLYEPLGFFGAISVAIALFVGRWTIDDRQPTTDRIDGRRSTTDDDEALLANALYATEIDQEPGVRSQESGRHGDREIGRQEDGETDLTAQPLHSTSHASQSSTTDDEQSTTDNAIANADAITRNLFPLFLAFWFVGSLVAFSWAGEKMPWLVTHIALPGNMLIAWGLGELANRLRWRELPLAEVALVPATVVLLIVAAGVMMWRFSPSGSDNLSPVAWLITSLIPLAFGGGLIFALLSLGQRLGWRPTLFVGVMTIAALLGMYMIRASWMVVYDHPDTPSELLIYTQSSPDVPKIVDEMRELAIAQTRNTRSTGDPTGGHTMPVIMDAGGEGSDGSLSWPFQWYLRDFQRLEYRNADFFQNATATSFDVQQPDGSTKPAPVVLVYKPHVNETARQALEANYTKRYDTKLNWWFPEGDLSGCNPQIPGYKQFFYSTLTINQAKADPQCAGINFDNVRYAGPLAPIAWVLDREHWGDTARFVIWRDLPEPLHIDGREMEVWVRKDLAPGVGGSTSGNATSLRLLAQQTIGQAGSDDGQLLEPRGVALDPQGNTYVADTGNNRVLVFDPNGTLLRTIGSFGAADGQFNEPRGVAVDAQGNLYVADTWNARVAKFDQNGTFVKAWGEGDQDFGNGRKATTTDRSEAGNQANQLGFFGPRSVAVDSAGNVYIADTGNRRIVVTDTEGNYRYQWGYEGAGAGQFNEPIGVAVDGLGNVYVADSWNGRIQVFSKSSESESIDALPTGTWAIPGWQINTYDDPYLAVASDGTVYATIPSQNQVYALNASGQALLSWGGAGDDSASLKLPSGVAVGANGDIYVADRGNGRVLRFPKVAVAPPSVP